MRCVTKSYGRGSTTIKALDSVSLEAHIGELVQLTGPSGAGKTTLLNLISALDRPDTGEILVAGANVTGLSLVSAAKYRNNQVGIIFQSYNLLPQLTALENVVLAIYRNLCSARMRPVVFKELAYRADVDALLTPTALNQ